MWRPRLVALDLDGTLLDAKARLGARARRAVERCVEQGAHVVLCTGRPPRMMHAYAEQLPVGASIVYNGASRYDHRDRSCVHHHALDPAEAAQVVARLRAGAPGTYLGIETSAGWFVDAALFEAARERLAASGLAPPDGVGRVEAFLQGGAIKIFARHPEHGVERLAAAVADLDVHATWSTSFLLEVMHARANKRDALERLAGELGVERVDTAAFGDNHNDAPMLAWAGLGVAVANASPEALAAADEVTAAHDADGVTQVLERWFCG